MIFLTDHLQIHTNVKPLKCRICSKQFFNVVIGEHGLVRNFKNHITSCMIVVLREIFVSRQGRNKKGSK